MQPPAGWLPIPLGSTQPQLGYIAPLPQQWWACFPQHRRQLLLRQRPQQQAQQRQPGSSMEQQAAASPAAAAAGAVESPPLWAAEPLAPQAWESPGVQQPQALRRVQQPGGLRSILRGSQQQLLQQSQQQWASQQQSQQQELQPEALGWDASQPAPAAVLVGSDPGTAGRGGRRVQFQLPSSPAPSFGASQPQQQRSKDKRKQGG